MIAVLAVALVAAAWIVAAVAVALVAGGAIALANRLDPKAAVRAGIAEAENYANRGTR